MSTTTADEDVGTSDTTRAVCTVLDTRQGAADLSVDLVGAGALPAAAPPDSGVPVPRGALNKRAAQKAETRDRLLGSALRLFGEQGYRATSIEAVASGAGLSRVGFYLHFAGLADLAKELVQPAVSELFAHYRRLDDLPTDLDSLARWSRELVEIWHVNAVRIRVGEYVVEVDPTLRGLWASGMDDAGGLLPRYVARWSAAGRRSSGTLRLTALMLQHERLCYLMMASPGAVEPAALVDLLTEQCQVLLLRDPHDIGIAPELAPRGRT